MKTLKGLQRALMLLKPGQALVADKLRIDRVEAVYSGGYFVVYEHDEIIWIVREPSKTADANRARISLSHFLDEAGWRFDAMQRARAITPPPPYLDIDDDFDQTRRYYLGVTRQGNQWQAWIYDMRTVYLGVYDSPHDAAMAHDEYVLLSRIDKPLNFPTLLKAQQP